MEEIDRKQEWLYGRSFVKLNILDGWFYAEVMDPQDVLLDRFMNPWDLNSARRITHVGIYRTLSECERNPMYSKEALTRLREFFATGLMIAGQNVSYRPRGYTESSPIAHQLREAILTLYRDQG